MPGKCVVCGATDELHFDHDLPWVKGWTSVVAGNVQLLRARHKPADATYRVIAVICSELYLLMLMLVQHVLQCP
ncbi:MAG TPA: hypothetical protein VGP62_04870 [Bryobacteraceae bacterium]|nr:hypothetical protein [Bryobacteraceae bacterium]